MNKKLLTIKEVSEYLNVSGNTSYGWIHQDTIPFIKCGHLVRFSLDSIDRWLADNTFDYPCSIKKIKKKS